MNTSLRLGVIGLTILYFFDRLIVSPKSYAYADSFTNAAGYTFGWKVGDLLRGTTSWGKLNVVIVYVITYGLIVLSVIAIMGLVRDAQNKGGASGYPMNTTPAPMGTPMPATVATPPGIMMPSPPAANAPPANNYDALQRAHEMHRQGILSDAEFESEKRKLLD